MFEEKNLLRKMYYANKIFLYNGFLKSRSRNFLRETRRFYCFSGALRGLRFQNFPGEYAPGPPQKAHAFGVR
jgi:hypothetical protein